MSQKYTIDRNIVYGMVSGAAMLGDLYRPKEPNGLGLIHISGSGWHAPRTYDATPLKEAGHVAIYVHPLAARGYTIFTINHRAAPTFRYPAALHDAQRAVRFLRHNAAAYGIKPNKIGAIGGSSGGHLVSMLAVLNSPGNLEADDPVEQESAGVQCVAARAAPVDLMRRTDRGTVVSLLGRAAEQPAEEDPLYRDASPVTFVSEKTPPILLYHGTADEIVPFEQSTIMEEALRAHGVPVRLIPIEGAGHGPDLPGAINPPDLIHEIDQWLQTHL